ncbi:MAG: hypothetical protein R3343_14515, partial [Nitriliruptorales bacterium]|nr:hypothetical protein [Nitriliruptorales bacterium]
DASGVAAAVDAYRDGELTTEEFRAIEFTKLDEFDAGGRGIFLDGQAPGHLLYCAHWFEVNPQFDGAGKMVVSYYDRGTRFVEVATDGTMTEIGWITPAEGYSGSAQWISDEVVYIMDYRRGMEVIKLTGDVATGTYTHRTDVIPASSTIEPAGLAAPAPGGLGGTTIAVGLGLLLLAVARRRRRDPRTT